MPYLLRAFCGVHLLAFSMVLSFQACAKPSPSNSGVPPLAPPPAPELLSLGDRHKSGDTTYTRRSIHTEPCISSGSERTKVPVKKFEISPSEKIALEIDAGTGLSPLQQALQASADDAHIMVFVKDPLEWDTPLVINGNRKVEISAGRQSTKGTNLDYQWFLQSEQPDITIAKDLLETDTAITCRDNGRFVIRDTYIDLTNSDSAPQNLKPQFVNEAHIPPLFSNTTLLFHDSHYLSEGDAILDDSHMITSDYRERGEGRVVKQKAPACRHRNARSCFSTKLAALAGLALPVAVYAEDAETAASAITETVTSAAIDTSATTATETITETVAETIAGTITETATETITEAITETITDTVTETITDTITETITDTITETITDTITDTITPAATVTVTQYVEATPVAVANVSEAVVNVSNATTGILYSAWGLVSGMTYSAYEWLPYIFSSGFVGPAAAGAVIGGGVLYCCRGSLSSVLSALRVPGFRKRTQASSFKKTQFSTTTTYKKSN